MAQGMRRVSIDGQLTGIPGGSRGTVQRTLALAGHAEELGYKV
jgi:hypothetical protein